MSLIEGIVRQRAAQVDAAELAEGPLARGDPDAVTLTLTCADPNSLEVVTRIHPEGGGLLWVGRKGSPLGPIELGPDDAVDLGGFLDAVMAGEVELVLVTCRSRSYLIKVSWPEGTWLAGVSFGIALAALLGRRKTMVGATYGPSI